METPSGIVRFLAWKKTRRLHKPSEDFSDLELMAFLLYEDEAFQHFQAVQARRQINEVEEAPAEEPVFTGDPKADEWEKIIAEGGLPDWMMEGIEDGGDDD